MSKTIRILAASGTLLLGSCASAHAAALTPAQLLQKFNLIVTGNVTGTSGGHIHGRALVGGDVSGVSEVFSHGDGASSDFAALTVAGSVTSQLKVQAGGNAAVGGGAGNLQMNGNGSISEYVSASAPENYGQVLSTYAQGLAALDVSMAGVSANTQNGQVRGYQISGVTSAVIALTEADIFRDNFTFNLGDGVDWVLVNVFATDSDKVFNPGSAFKLQQGGTTAQKLLWNFVDFDEVRFDARFSVGALLADGALVKTTGGDIEGSLFAKDFHGASQLHYNGVNVLPAVASAPPAPVPLPAGALLLLGGLGGLALLRRRKTAA